MVSFVANLVALLKGYVFREVRHASKFVMPPPTVFRKILDEEYCKTFEEIIIIGDVHGCYDEMIELLEKIHESARDGNKILKIFTGDLVNKGPKSKDTLRYCMSNDSILSVRGNHDEVVIKEYMKYQLDPTSLTPKNEWMKNLSEDEFKYLANLPYTIEIPFLNLVVVHAGIIPGVDIQDMTARDLVTMRNVAIGEDGKTYTATSKEEIGEPWAKHWNGPEHIYFGHDAKRLLQKYSYATGLDSGCVYGNQLTGHFVFGKRKGDEISVNAKSVHLKPRGTIV